MTETLYEPCPVCKATIAGWGAEDLAKNKATHIDHQHPKQAPKAPEAPRVLAPAPVEKPVEEPAEKLSIVERVTGKKRKKGK